MAPKEQRVPRDCGFFCNTPIGYVSAVDELTELARAAQAGDRLALGAFIRKAQNPVRQFCHRLVDRERADDLTQEVFVRAWQGLGGFRFESRALSWVMGIAYKVCSEQRRRDRRQELLHGRLGNRKQVQRPDHGEQIALENLIDELPRDQRAAVVLTQMLGFTYAEAAEVCETETGTIRSRVARARARLLQVLQEDDAAPSLRRDG